MSVYYTYAIELARRLTPDANQPIKVLDYGCGAGQIVVNALDRGLDAYGVDLFYEGGNSREAAKKTGHWDTRIFDLRDGGAIPMADGSFDVVFANQVFEHIDDFTVPLAEIHRVLKPGGIFINIFPSKLVWREGHIGIPFAHWMPRNRLRHWYTLGLRSLGAGYNKRKGGPRKWTESRLKWLDDWTFYKPLPVIERAFSRHFSIERYEGDYLVHRFETHPRLRRLAGLVRSGPMRPLMAFTSSRLAGHVFVLRKDSGRPATTNQAA